MSIVRNDYQVEKEICAMLREAQRELVLERMRRRKNTCRRKRKEVLVYTQKASAYPHKTKKAHKREKLRKSRDKCETFSVQFLVGFSLVRNFESFGCAKSKFSIISKKDYKKERSKIVKSIGNLEESLINQCGLILPYSFAT